MIVEIPSIGETKYMYYAYGTGILLLSTFILFFINR
ncbi:unnamed protein product [Schistosoma margrebowiei]|nr:unnamed protein product [Schistosoma margrebowiei]